MSTELVAADIKVGRVYAAKRPARIGFIDCHLNDRQVMWIDRFGDRVQYDSPTVSFGSKHPIVPMERFLKWAKADVTDQCPKDEWRKA